MPATMTINLSPGALVEPGNASRLAAIRSLAKKHSWRASQFRDYDLSLVAWLRDLELSCAPSQETEVICWTGWEDQFGKNRDLKLARRERKREEALKLQEARAIEERLAREEDNRKWLAKQAVLRARYEQDQAELRESMKAAAALQDACRDDLWARARLLRTDSPRSDWDAYSESTSAALQELRLRMPDFEALRLWVWQMTGWRWGVIAKPGEGGILVYADIPCLRCGNKRLRMQFENVPLEDAAHPDLKTVNTYTCETCNNIVIVPVGNPRREE